MYVIRVLEEMSSRLVSIIYTFLITFLGFFLLYSHFRYINLNLNPTYRSCSLRHLSVIFFEREKLFSENFAGQRTANSGFLKNG